MKNVALGALFVGLVACGGGGENPDVIVPQPDAPDVTPGACNPLLNTGCNAGEKCTWIRDQVSPAVGHIGCSPDGTIAVGGQNCAAPGGLGADLCVAKSICIGSDASSTCEAVCDPVMPTAQNGCTVGESACSRYSGLFVVSGAIAFGACDTLCNVVTQAQLGSTPRASCGGDGQSRGCFGGGASFEEFTCARVPMEARALRDRQNAFGPTPDGDDAFTNGCAAGLLPFFFEMAGSMRVLCTAVCAAEGRGTISMVNGAQEDGNPAIDGFSVDATPQLAAGNASCAVGKKGALASEECRYIWPFNNDGMQFLPGANNNIVGVCFNPPSFEDPAMPRGPGNSPKCNTLTEAQANGGLVDPANPGSGAADSAGCGPDTNFAPIPLPGQQKPTIGKYANMRVGARSGKALRHHFE